jgi:carbamoyltransferase
VTDDAPWILGFSDSVHDRSVCLFRGGTPLVAIEEERLSRTKHAIEFQCLDRRDAHVFAALNLDAGHASDHEARLEPLVAYCLDAAGIDREDIDLWIGNSLHSAFPFADCAVYVNHHLAHAASTFFGSGFADAAILVVDGYGDALSGEAFETVSIFSGADRSIVAKLRVGGRKRGLHLDDSLGIFYRIGTLLGGFGVMDEGKLMGLAAWGRPNFEPLIRRHVELRGDEMHIANDDLWNEFVSLGLRQASQDQRADIASSFQSVLEDLMLHYARLAAKLTGHRRLCVAGGVALNCVANQRIVDAGLFEEVFAFPAAADNGIAFGAAYFGAHRLLGMPRGQGLASVSLGRRYSLQACEAALAASGIAVTVERLDDEQLTARVAARLATGAIVMWFQGGSEFGPRALGHRSILADARQADVRDHINAAVKSRELFRPLAPVILREELTRWFDGGPSPFMLFSPRAREQTKRQTPAIVHVDGSARLQTLSRASNPKLHRLLTAFHETTGVPILLNTSFNLKDQPIVETPAEAIQAFAQSPVRVLCLEDLLIEKRGAAP